MFETKSKFPLWLMPETRQMVEDNYKADGCRSRSEYIEKAIEFYTGYRHAVLAEDYLPRTLFNILDRVLTGLADRVGRLMFKMAVENNLVCHLLAEDVDMSYGEYEELREMCIREVKQCRGEINFMDAQHRYIEPLQLPDTD